MTNQYNINIDPDINYFRAIETLKDDSIYFQQESFCDKFKNNQYELSMIHFNIRSLSKHFDQLLLYLGSLNTHFSLIGLTEIWGTEINKDNFDIKHYSYYQQIRPSKRSGGVALYVSESLNSFERPDLSLQHEDYQATFAEIDKRNFDNFSNNIIVGVIYRSPNSNIQDFNNAIELLLEQIRKEKKTVYLMGDYNIDLIKVDNNAQYEHFVDIMVTHSLLPSIHKPTRITNDTATLIDNIFSNDCFSNIQSISGILCSDITDHFPIFKFCDLKRNKQTATEVTYRDINPKNKEKFASLMSNIDWSPVITCNNAQSAYTIFHDSIKTAYDESFPKKKAKYKIKDEPWITKGLKKAINMKNKLYLRSLKYATITNELIYKRYKNKLEHLIRISKRNHYRNELQANKGNLKKMWSILRDIINKRQGNKSPLINILYNGKTTSNPSIIASEFNRFFSTVGGSLAATIPSSSNEPSDFMPAPLLNSIYLEKVDEDELILISKSLKNSAPGYDELNPSIMKDTIGFYLRPLAHVVNLSLEQGCVPDEVKRAIVTPVFKKGETNDLNNYRPISVLPFFSKLFEKVMYNRLISFLEKHNVLYKYQFGFRKKLSTEMALIIAKDKISDEMDDGNSVIGIFLDFTKAFDTVNHDILLSKLYNYGIRGVAFSWFKSYLENRTQAVKYGGSVSELLNINLGIPQGSLIGPLLFLLYINDLPNVSPIILPIMYADDTNIFLSHNDTGMLIRQANIVLDRIYIWLCSNRLSLNVSKTKFMLFSRKKNIDNEFITLQLNNCKLEKVSSTTFLGVTIDDALSWKTHIDIVSNKVAKAIGIIYRASPILEQSSRMLLYNTLIYPHVHYCNLIWGNANVSYFKRLVTLQKRAIRIVCSLDFRESTVDAFMINGILNITQLNVFLSSIFVYKWLYHKLPSIFDCYFTFVKTNHSYGTRCDLLLRLPLRRTEHGKRCIKNHCSNVWNSIIRYLLPPNNITQFKDELRTYIYMHT